MSRTRAYGPARHGPAACLGWRRGTKCQSGRANPMAGGPCLVVPGPGRAGWAFWPSINHPITAFEPSDTILSHPILAPSYR